MFVVVNQRAWFRARRLEADANGDVRARRQVRENFARRDFKKNLNLCVSRTVEYGIRIFIHEKMTHENEFYWFSKI